MPHCPECGAENEEDAGFCTKCGAPLTQESERRAPGRYRYDQQRAACFGPPGSGVGTWGAISSGVFIIGLGILWFFDWWWPGILILVGLMIAIGGLVASQRR